MAYTYTDLATPTTIRVIQVMPEKFQGNVACRIYSYDPKQPRPTDHNLSYRALSYRWGDSTCTRNAFLADTGTSEWHQQPLHENLWRFLDHVWQLQLFEDYFWIDYLSLNQRSDEELKQQIPRMGVIYSEATDVVIWLCISKTLEDHLVRFLNYYWQRDAMLAYSVRPLWKNEYWGRIWIVQEVALAKRAIIMMRSLSISLEDLEARLSRALSGSVELGPPSMTELCHIRRQRKWGRVDLCYLLENFICQSYHCTKRNDRIYGVLGLWESSKPSVQVDYARPYDHAVLDVIFEAAAHGQSFSIRGALDKLNIKLTRDSNALEEYIRDERTPLKYKGPARLALQSFDAMCYFLASTMAREPQHSIRFEQQGFTSHPRLGLQKEFVFLGITLAYGSDKPWASALLENWESCRKRKLWRGSPWLCETHRIDTHGFGRESRKAPCTEEYMEESLQEYIKRYQEMPSLDAYDALCRREYVERNRRPSTDALRQLHRGWFNEESRLHGDSINPRLVMGMEWVGWEPKAIVELCPRADQYCAGPSRIFEIPFTHFRMTLTGALIRLEIVD